MLMMMTRVARDRCRAVLSSGGVRSGRASRLDRYPRSLFLAFCVFRIIHIRTTDTTIHDSPYTRSTVSSDIPMCKCNCQDE